MKKKVLIIINNLGIGGAERLVVDDINEMLARGIPIKLLTLKKEPKSSFAEQCKINKNDWTVISFGSLYSLASWLATIRFIARYKPDVVITHLWYSNTIGRISAKICRVKTVITFEHNVYDLIKSKKMFFVDRLLQHFSSHIIAVSGSVRDSLTRVGIDTKKIKVIYNGIDISKYSEKSKDKIRKDLSIEGEFIYLFVGRMIHQKGVDILLKAFAKVPTGVLLLVGEGNEKEALIKLAQDLGIEQRIYFLGIRDDIANLLSSADCFVLSSRSEGLGIVVLEALAAGKPIIVSNFGPASEIIQNGHNGMIFPIENVEILAEIMSLIATDIEKREYLAKNAIESSWNFSIQKHVDLLLES
jgi:glycosyltransferase involved in cell wall biosynthesis